MAGGRMGERVKGTLNGRYEAYVPAPLPPDPPLEMERLYAALDEAGAALGRLDGLSALLPDADLFLYMYVRQEALLSSQIEGTRSTLSDLLLFELDETPGVPIDDVEEVSNYVAALNYGLRRLDEGFPLSLRLIREVHAVLLRGGRGAAKSPGDFRSSLVWIGGASPATADFVPPPPDRLEPCLDALERFINDAAPMPALIRAGLAHAQFETIHPFLDGNGRVGRLLITLMLTRDGLLAKPMLYLSLYLKAYRPEYYRLLQKVRFDGAWEEWLIFFLNGVASVSRQAGEAAGRILDLFDADRKRIDALGRRAPGVAAVHGAFMRRPILDVPTLAKRCPLSAPTVRAAVTSMLDMGMLEEITGRRRDRVYRYSAYYAVLAEGTEPVRG